MTSLFSRLQKLNKEATPAPWEASRGSSFNQAELRAPDPWNGLMLIRRAVKEDDIDLIVECRNSLPAVLNAIELLRRLSGWDALAPPVQAPFGDGPYWKREIDAVLEPFNKEQP